jgi:predicted ATPase
VEAPETWAAIAFIEKPSAVYEAVRALETRNLLVSAQTADGRLSIELTSAGQAFVEEEGRKRFALEVDPDFESKPVEPFYLDEVVISNFKCFTEEQTLNLTDRENHPSRWTILLGENGVGKTTILQIIAALFPTIRTAGGSHSIEITTDRHEWVDIFSSGPRSVSRESVIEARFRRGAITEIDPKYVLLGVSNYSLPQLEKIVSEVTLETDNTSFSIRGDPYLTYSGNFISLRQLPLLVAYSATRTVGETKLAGDEDHPVASLFRPNLPLKNPEEWLLRADYASRFNPGRSTKGKASLERVRRTLLQLLPDVRDITVSAPDERYDQPYVSFATSYGPVRYEDLSLGYQSTVAWVVDLAARMIDAYPSSSHPLQESAIVLIDEVDLHLHPRWQRSFMTHLEKVFVNTQFIATTHSPLVVQGSPSVNLALLRRAGNHVEIVNDVDEISTWRADQILTSDLFGLDSARPPNIAQLQRRRVQLMSKPDLAPADERALAKIEEQLSSLPDAPDATTDQAMRLINDAADELRRRQAS